jgi:hypothetical protein
MRTSDQTDIIDAALAKAQAEIENPTKDATNPHFRSKYATLDAGLNIVRTCLSKHGISVTQPTRVEDGILMLETRIACQGQWIASEYPVCAFPVKQQEMGSALTYSRRYSLFSLVGIAGEEDDDANAATSSTPAPKRASNKVDAGTSAVAKDAAIMAISMAQSVEILESWAVDHKVEMDRMAEADVSEVRKAYKAKHTELKQQQKEAA